MIRSALQVLGVGLVIACVSCGGTDTTVVPPDTPPLGSAPRDPGGPNGSSGSGAGPGAGTSGGAASSSGGASSGGASSGGASSGGSSGSPSGDCALPPGTTLVAPFDIRKISGDGQAISSSWPNLDPIVVEVRDAKGFPAKGKTVTFTPHGDAWAVPATVITDDCGRAHATARGQKTQPGSSYTTGMIEATVDYRSVGFAVTIFDQVIAPTIQVLAPSSMDLGSGSVGTVAAGAVRVAVAPSTGPFSGQGVADIGVRLIGLDASGNPDFTKTGIASCAGGTVMTNSQGIATCDVRFDQPGDGVGLIVGGRTVWRLSASVAP